MACQNIPGESGGPDSKDFASSELETSCWIGAFADSVLALNRQLKSMQLQKQFSSIENSVARCQTEMKSSIETYEAARTELTKRLANVNEQRAKLAEEVQKFNNMVQQAGQTLEKLRAEIEAVKTLKAGSLAY